MFFHRQLRFVSRSANRVELHPEGHGPAAAHRAAGHLRHHHLRHHRPRAVLGEDAQELL